MGIRRFVLRGALAAAFLASPAHAQEPPPIVVEPPIPDTPPPALPPPAPTTTQPAPVQTFLPPPRPPPAPAPAPAPPAPPPPSKEPEVARATLGGLGVGPTYFGMSGRGRNRGVGRGGLVFELKTRVPIGDHFGIGIRGAWGLTEFHRIEDWARPGYKIGKWVGGAYESVYDWAGEGEKDTRGLRYIGAFFAFVVLWVPLIVALPFYILSPLGATTYFETDVTVNYDFGADGKTGPYAKLGVGLVGFVDPRNNDMFGGLGPNGGLGYRAGSLDLGIGGTYLPPGFHGGLEEHVLIGAFTIGFAH